MLVVFWVCGGRVLGVSSPLLIPGGDQITSVREQGVIMESVVLQ